MNLEQKINAVISEHNVRRDHFYEIVIPIEYWDHEIRKSGFLNNGFLLGNIHSLIREADLAECLTSPIKYIRDYKIWYNKFYGQKSK